jgi:hypothetical protein
MELHSIESLLSGSPFADHAKDIADVFGLLKIKTLDDLDNAPRLLGPRVAGYSTFQVCAYLRQAAIDHVIAGPVEKVEVPPEPEPEPIPKPKRKTKAKKEPEPEPEETKPEERSDE